MKHRHALLLSVFLLLAAPGSFGQEHVPRIAVFPFNYLNVSRADAEAIWGLFETALVSTTAFHVIEQNRVHEILQAQEYSLSDCTSEECAIQFGQLLSAEQIVLGALSSLGGKHFLNARIIDVAKGVNLRAGKVEAASLADLPDAAELLAYKLAGLTRYRGGMEEVAREFGEIFLETDPPGAEVYVNGQRRGSSPILISKVPLGTVRVESRNGNLYGRQDVRVGRGTIRLSLRLAQQYGNLFLRSQIGSLEAYLDGTRLGVLGSGFFERIPAGPHVVELIGEGWYWREEVLINGGESTQVEASPQAYGTLRCRLPEKATAEIVGETQREVIADSAELTLWAGTYSVQVAGERYEPYSTELTIHRGQTVVLEPALCYNREYECASFTRLIEEAERVLSADQRMEQKDIGRVQDLKRSILASRHALPELAARAEALIGRAKGKKARQDSRDELVQLAAREQRIAERIRKIEQARERQRRGGWWTFGAGAVSLGVSGLFVYLGEDAYWKYRAAPTREEWNRYRQVFQRWDTLTVTAWAVGGACLGSSLLLWAIRPRPERFEAELVGIRARMAVLMDAAR